jgi:hypothetical protein
MDDRPGTIARPRELLLVVLAGAALSILMTWPLATGLGHLGRTMSTDADGQYSIWNIAWVARTIVADPLRLFDANIFHPHKTTLAYSEANILPGLIGVPAYWLTKNPWLTLNVVLLFAFTSAYVGAYLLLKYLTGDRRAAAAGALLYAFCPYVFSHLSHIQLLMTGGIPLSMLMLHRVADAVSFRLKAEATGMGEANATPLSSNPVASAFRRKDPSRRKILFRGIALGLALAGQALSCAYYGVFAGLMVGYGALVLAGTRRLWRSTEYWIAIAAGAVTSLALVTPFFMPFLRVQRETGFGRSVEDTARWAAGARDYLMSATHAHAGLLAYLRSFGPWSGEVLFPGLLALGLGAAGCIVAVRRAGRPRETALLYGSLAILAFWASFGPQAGLYRALYYLPTFSFLRAPSRLGLVVVLCLAVFASFALAAIVNALAPRLRIVAAAVASAAIIAELAVFPLRWATAPDLPSPYAQLAISPRAPVAEFPFYGERIAFPLHAQYMLFSTRHWMPLVNGYSDVIPADFREAAAVLDGFPSDDAFLVLARRRVRYIAIHWDMFAGRHDEIRRRLEPYAGNLKLLAEDPRMTLYEVVRYP